MSIPLIPSVWLILGFALAALGGDFLVRGILRLGSYMRIPVSILGSTLAAWATSGPELAVAISSSQKGLGELALGDSLGSNVFNLSVILGVSLLFAPQRVESEKAAISYTVALLAPFVTTSLIMDGVLSRMDAGILLLVFILWLGLTLKALRFAENQSKFSVRTEWKAWIKGVALVVIGTANLFLAGQFVVKGVEALKYHYSIDSFMIGAILIAFGTSTPELATTLVARFKGHHDLSLATLLGSNLFNGLFVVGIAALMQPIQVDKIICLVTLLFGTLVVSLTISRSNILTRNRGGFLIFVYVNFLLAITFLSQ